MVSHNQIKCTNLNYLSSLHHPKKVYSNEYSFLFEKYAQVLFQYSTEHAVSGYRSNLISQTTTSESMDSEDDYLYYQMETIAWVYVTFHVGFGDSAYYITDI